MKLNNQLFQRLKLFLFKYGEPIIVGLILLLAFIIRFTILQHTIDFHGISNGKILEARLILNDPLNLKLWTPVHPPMHMLFLIIGMKLCGSFLAVSRYISLVFGLLTILMAYLCLKQIFNKQIAAFSALAISLYSAHIVYSIIGTSETSFHFFVFLGIYLYEQFKQKKGNTLLCILGLSVGMASMCRYEGLLLIPFYIFFLIKRKSDIIIFIFSALMIPSVWMLTNYTAFGNPIEFLASNNFIVPIQLNWIRDNGLNIDFIYKLLFWPKVLISTMGISVCMFGLAGIVYSVSNHDCKEIRVMFIMFFLVFVLNTLRETLYLQPRYGIILGLMLIPFSVFFCIRIIEKISIKIPKWAVLILLWTMIIPIGRQVLASPLNAPDFAKNIAFYLRENQIIGANILLDHCGDEKYREPIKVLSRIDPIYYSLMPKKMDNNDYVVDKEKVFRMFSDDNIKTLVYSPVGDLHNILNLNTQDHIQQRQDFIFTLKYKNAPYFIYGIKKAENDQ